MEGCPIYLPPPDLTPNSLEATFRWTKRNVIILSQTCDIVKGREKITEVLLCLVWNRSEHTDGHLSTNRGMEDARRGQLPSQHVLDECKLAEIEKEFRIVDFRCIYTLPLDFCRSFAAKSPNRIRFRTYAVVSKNRQLPPACGGTKGGNPKFCVSPKVVTSLSRASLSGFCPFFHVSWFTYRYSGVQKITRSNLILAKHYGFTDEELDFIINYDIKYRMGLGN